MHLEDKIQQKYPELSSYGEYLCYYYQVSSLDELSRKQKSEILDGSRFHVSDIGNKNVLKEEKTLTYACSENDGRIYIVHEFDKEVIELGYNYYFDSLMMFSFDKSLADISQDRFDYTIMNYLDENSNVRQQLDQFLIGKTIPTNSELTFDSIQYHISAPLMGNAYSRRDVSSFLTFTFQLEPIVIDGYAFQDGNNDGIMQKEEERVANLKVNLWQDKNLVATTLTNEKGYYCFENQMPEKSYYITTDNLKDYTVTKINSHHYYGNRFFADDQKVIKCAPFTAKIGHEFNNVGFVEVTYLVNYEANGGVGEQVDEKNPYHENNQVVILGQGDIKREGYQFVGWNTQFDCLGKTFLEKDTVTMPSHNITLYAMWKKNVIIDVDKPKDSVSTNQVQISDYNETVLFVSLMILASITVLFVTKSLKKNR